MQACDSSIVGSLVVTLRNPKSGLVHLRTCRNSWTVCSIRAYLQYEKTNVSRCQERRSSCFGHVRCHALSRAYGFSRRWGGWLGRWTITAPFLVVLLYGAPKPQCLCSETVSLSGSSKIRDSPLFAF